MEAGPVAQSGDGASLQAFSDADAQSFAINERYRVYNRVLGRGQTGVVRAGVDLQTGDEIAVKVLDRAHTERDPARREALRREITVSMRLQHENIIRLYAVVLNADRIHLIMEIARGGELFATVAQRGAVPEDECRTYFHQLISAVDYCHSQSVCHRDLKLENILLKEPGATQIKITDFGFSKDFLNESLPKTKRLGTLAYMAPEVALDGQGSYDGHMADVWGCGVILYTLAAGRYPFGDESQDQPTVVYQRVVSGQFAEIPCGQVSRECVDLIRKILVPDPAQRATIAEIKAHAWFTGTVFRDPPLPGSIGSISSIGSDGLPEFQWPSYDDFQSSYVLEAAGAAGSAAPDPAMLGVDLQSDLSHSAAGDGGGHSSGGSGSAGGGSFLSSNSSGHEEMMMMAPPPPVGSSPPGGWSQGSFGTGAAQAPQARWASWTTGASVVGAGSSSAELREHTGGQSAVAAPAVARPRIRSDASDGSTGSFGSVGSLREDWGDVVGEGGSATLRPETL